MSRLTEAAILSKLEQYLEEKLQFYKNIDKEKKTFIHSINEDSCKFYLNCIKNLRNFGTYIICFNLNIY